MGRGQYWTLRHFERGSIRVSVVCASGIRTYVKDFWHMGMEVVLLCTVRFFHRRLVCSSGVFQLGSFCLGCLANLPDGVEQSTTHRKVEDTVAANAIRNNHVGSSLQVLVWQTDSVLFRQYWMYIELLLSERHAGLSNLPCRDLKTVNATKYSLLKLQHGQIDYFVFKIV